MAPLVSAAPVRALGRVSSPLSFVRLRTLSQNLPHHTPHCLSHYSKHRMGCHLAGAFACGLLLRRSGQAHGGQRSFMSQRGQRHAESSAVLRCGCRIKLSQCAVGRSGQRAKSPMDGLCRDRLLARCQLMSSKFFCKRRWRLRLTVRARWVYSLCDGLGRGGD